MEATNEQNLIISKAATGTSFVVNALAGSGKSSSMRLVAESLPTKRILYLVFNKANAEEAREKFPSNVDCRTISSLAWREIVKSMNSGLAKRLNSNYGSFNLKEWDLPKEILTLCPKSKFKETFNKYMYSSFSSLQAYIDYYNKSHPKAPILFEKEHLDLWAKINNVKSTMALSHDWYLKEYQLSNPDLSDYDVILVDEAQDISRVQVDIIEKQIGRGVQVILVGDTNQAIYEFRGCMDSLKYFSSKFKFEVLALTKSFRFGTEIAQQVNAFMTLTNAEFNIVGAGKQVLSPTTVGYLGRNNRTIMEFLFSWKGGQVNCTINFKDLKSKMWHIQALMSDTYPKFPNAALRDFHSKKELLDAAKEDEDLAGLIKTYSFVNEKGITSFFKEVEAKIDAKGKSLTTLTTIHRSKGLEFDKVQFLDDIAQPRGDDYNLLEEGQEVNLLYVALTRAKHSMQLNEYTTNLLATYNY